MYRVVTRRNIRILAANIFDEYIMRVVWNGAIFRLRMLRDTTIAIALVKFETWSRMHVERAKYFFLGNMPKHF